MIYCNNIDARYNGTYRNIFNDLQYIDDGIHYNKDFWAFAYKEDERALNLMCKPVKGRIKEDKYFYEYSDVSGNIYTSAIETIRFTHTVNNQTTETTWNEPSISKGGK